MIRLSLAPRSSRLATVSKAIEDTPTEIWRDMLAWEITMQRHAENRQTGHYKPTDQSEADVKYLA